MKMNGTRGLGWTGLGIRGVVSINPVSIQLYIIYGVQIGGIFFTYFISFYYSPHIIVTQTVDIVVSICI